MRPSRSDGLKIRDLVLTVAALASTGIACAQLRAPADDAGPVNVVRPSITLDNPNVIDSATLQSGDTTVTLHGVEGIAGPAAAVLEPLGQLTCEPQANSSFVCLTSDGTDVAQIALLKGLAKTTDDAPAPYRDREAEAQAARRGIWASLPPPPETVTHPVVYDTATLSAQGKTYALDGLIGLAAPYSGQLQDYIDSHGNSVTCMPQNDPGHYVCLLSDGTDVAKVALAEGLATVAADAPRAYRSQQSDAVSNRRGYWANAPETVIAAMTRPPELPTVIIGDDGTGGITYAGDAPVALIAGETVFLIYGAEYLGWGYYDRFHHWHGVPDRYRTHLEQFHPDVDGARRYGQFQQAPGTPVIERAGTLPNVIHPGTAGSVAYQVRNGPVVVVGPTAASGPLNLVTAGRYRDTAERPRTGPIVHPGPVALAGNAHIAPTAPRPVYSIGHGGGSHR